MPKHRTPSELQTLATQLGSAPVFINEYEAAALSCDAITVATLRKWRWQGKSPRFYKIGANVRYKYLEFIDFLNSCARNSTGDSGE